MSSNPVKPAPRNRTWNLTDRLFLVVLAVLGGSYVLLILAMVAADTGFTSWRHIRESIGDPEILYSIRLSLVSATVTALLSLWVAVPLGYLLSRFEFRGKMLVDAVLDIPIVLPPLVIGLSLLILFQRAPGRWFEDSVVGLTYERLGVVLAQFAVACAFAVRTMRVTFEQNNPRGRGISGEARSPSRETGGPMTSCRPHSYTGRCFRPRSSWAAPWW